MQKPRWIDFDAGKLVSTSISMDELLSEFIDKVIDIVNGEYCKNEHNDIRELTIWKNGVTL
ncbi:UxaA family hydrolase [Grimontia hollisae]|uniref:UxaA family hydrolase n=1 Tax=Grimontia hollisae TaxID=673 RepID=UPI0028687F3A|nr:UxaA family hydrolase [Grimontia hollisae]